MMQGDGNPLALVLGVVGKYFCWLVCGGFGVPRNRKRCLAALAIFGGSILVDVRFFSASVGGGVLWLE